MGWSEGQLVEVRTVGTCPAGIGDTEELHQLPMMLPRQREKGNTLAFPFLPTLISYLPLTRQSRKSSDSENPGRCNLQEPVPL
jgi:hypothetical protein